MIYIIIGLTIIIGGTAILLYQAFKYNKEQQELYERKMKEIGPFWEEGEE